MKVVIMAGGRGTRISELFPDIPKPLIPIEGVPVLERELVSLRDQGFKDFIMTVSYMGDKIMNYFGNGSKLGASIQYYNEVTPLGNAAITIDYGNSDRVCSWGRSCTGDFNWIYKAANQAAFN